MTREGLVPLAWLPKAWTSSVRRRRLLFILTTAPGVAVAELGAGVLHNLLTLAVGGALVLAAAIFRLSSEPRFLAHERGGLAAADLEALT